MNNNTPNIFTTDPVSEAKTGERLDVYLSFYLQEFSRSHVQKLIKSGAVSSSGEIKKVNSSKIEEGQVFDVIISYPEEKSISGEKIDINILYEDDDMLVINKPAGMTVHPAAGSLSGTLVNALINIYKENLSSIAGPERRGIVHRLDKDTSGVLLVAKNDKAHIALSEQFAAQTVGREYVAFVYSMPTPVEGSVESSIGRSLTDRKKMATLPTGGKLAITNYKVLQTFKGSASMVECRLETGRTHQIRVHMASLGCHVIGDNVYVKPRKSSVNLPLDIKNYVNKFPRQALHARKVTFNHPTKNVEMSFEAEMPEDMKALWEVLNTTS